MRKSSRRTAHSGRNRNWTELPDDITASILSRLGTLEILRTAQRVCMTWRKICKENSLVWKTIYIHDENYIDMTYLDKICRHVIDLSSGNLVDVSIEYIGTDQLLKYMAESSSGIRRLRFVNCTRLTDEGFSEVALKLPLLEDLDISKCDNISSKSLQLAVSLQMKNLIVESDSAVLVALLQRDDFDLHPIKTLLRNRRQLMEYFYHFQIKHIHKEGDMVADLLAKASVNHSEGLCFRAL